MPCHDLCVIFRSGATSLQNKPCQTQYVQNLHILMSTMLETAGDRRQCAFCAHCVRVGRVQLVQEVQASYRGWDSPLLPYDFGLASPTYFRFSCRAAILVSSDPPVVLLGGTGKSSCKFRLFSKAMSAFRNVPKFALPSASRRLNVRNEIPARLAKASWDSSRSLLSRRIFLARYSHSSLCDAFFR